VDNEMKFMDAGRKINDAPAAPETKSYPRFTVDLDQFPGLQAEVDEVVELHLRGRVCGITHNDYCHSMDIEVTSVAVPHHTHATIGQPNEADKALGKMKEARRF